MGRRVDEMDEGQRDGGDDIVVERDVGKAK